MNKAHLMLLQEALERTPAAQLTLAEPTNCGGVTSFFTLAKQVVLNAAQEAGDPAPTSPCNFYGFEYAETMNFFLMVPPEDPTAPLDAEERRRVARLRRECLDAAPAEARKNAIIDLISTAVVTGRIDWGGAKARNGIECNA